MGKCSLAVLLVVSLLVFSFLLTGITLAQTGCVRNAPLLEYYNLNTKQVDPASGTKSETASGSTGTTNVLTTVSETYTIKVTNKDSASCGGSKFQFQWGSSGPYVTLGNCPRTTDTCDALTFASPVTIPAGQPAVVTGNTGNIKLTLVKSPQTFEIPVVVSRLLEAKIPALDSTTVKSATQGAYTMTIGFNKPSYAAGDTTTYFGTLKKNGAAFSGAVVSLEAFKTVGGLEQKVSQNSLTTGADGIAGSFKGEIKSLDSKASSYRVVAKYTDSSSPTSPITITLLNSFTISSKLTQTENPSATIPLKVVVTRESNCLTTINTGELKPEIALKSQTGTTEVVSGREITFDVTVRNRNVDCPDDRFGSPVVGIAEVIDPQRLISTEDTAAKLWEPKIDGNNPSRKPSSSAGLSGASGKLKYFIWEDFGIKDYTLGNSGTATHRLVLKAPLAPDEVGRKRNFAFCINSADHSQTCQTETVSVVASSAADKTPPSIASVSTDPSPVAVGKPMKLVTKVSDNNAVDKVMFSIDRNNNGVFEASEIQTKTLTTKITSGDVPSDFAMTFDSKGAYKFEVKVFDTSQLSSTTSGTIVVGDVISPTPTETVQVAKTNDKGDTIGLSTDKDSYTAGGVVAISGTLTLKSETVVSPSVTIEILDPADTSLAKFLRTVSSSGSFGLKTVLSDTAKSGNWKIKATYTSVSDPTKTLVSVEKIINVGGIITPITKPPTEVKPVSGTNAESDEIKISIDKDSYIKGKIITLTGTLNSKAGPIKDASIEIELLKPDGTSFQKFARTTSSDGTFGLKIVLPDSPLGNWKLTAKYPSKSLSVEKSFGITGIGGETPPTETATSTKNDKSDELKIQVDKSSYNRGEVATLSVTLTSQSGPVKDATVEIEILRPDGTSVGKFTRTTGSDGTFKFKLVIDPQDTTGNWKFITKHSDKSLSAEISFSVAESVAKTGVGTLAFPEAKVVEDGITISSRLSAYKDGDIPTFTGALFSQSKPVPNEKVKIVVTSSKETIYERTVITNEKGEFKIFFAIGRGTPSDTWKITVTSEKDSKTAQLEFKVN